MLIDKPLEHLLYDQCQKCKEYKKDVGQEIHIYTSDFIVPYCDNCYKNMTPSEIKFKVISV